MGTHVNVLGPEEELAAEVGVFHEVHVGNSHAATAPGSQAHEGKALEQLTANCSCTHLPAEQPQPQGPAWPSHRAPRLTPQLTRR